jgi:hypothetical protein
MSIWKPACGARLPKTGLTRDDLVVEPFLPTVKSQQRIANIQVLNSPENADALGERLREILANSRSPSLLRYLWFGAKTICARQCLLTRFRACDPCFDNVFFSMLFEHILDLESYADHKRPQNSGQVHVGNQRALITGRQLAAAVLCVLECK